MKNYTKNNTKKVLFIVQSSFILIALVAFAAMDTKAQIKEVSSDNIVEEISTQNNKVKKLCSKLEIPYNKDADVKLLQFINDWLGTKYSYGGYSKSGIDCFGYTNQIYTNIYKKKIPRSSKDIHAQCMQIKRNALYEGDMVFCATGDDP